jgi:hypothetical protein
MVDAEPAPICNGLHRLPVPFCLADSCRVFADGIGVDLSHCCSENSPAAWSAFWKFAPSFTIKAMQAETGRQIAVALYVVAMATVIVGVDFVFFRNRFWERLTVNIGIVLMFAAFYWRFLRRS